LGCCFRYEPSCARWKLGGEWRLRPDRKIFLATMVDSELYVLSVLLEEVRWRYLTYLTQP